jgi:hypothetical protein
MMVNGVLYRLFAVLSFAIFSSITSALGRSYVYLTNPRDVYVAFFIQLLAFCLMVVSLVAIFAPTRNILRPIVRTLAVIVTLSFVACGFMAYFEARNQASVMGGVFPLDLMVGTLIFWVSAYLAFAFFRSWKKPAGEKKPEPAKIAETAPPAAQPTAAETPFITITPMPRTTRPVGGGLTAP